jgi:lambda family phage tail tape measure protein
MADTVGAAQLAITADASGVEAGVSRAKKSLATLGGTAKQAGAEASKGVDQIGKGADGSAQKVDRATKQMIASIQRTTATMEAGSRSSSKFFETLAQQRGVNVSTLRPYLDQLDATARKQAAATAAAKATAPAIAQVGISARQTAFALRTVPAQFTDIVTQLAAGQNPMQVFIQQGGQLKDVFGGVGPAARALGGYIKGLINPVTIAAAAVAALGFAWFKGAKEGENYARAIILSGNAAGKTVGQLQQMAERISEVQGTQAAAAAALVEVVQSGQVAGEQIERFTAIALRMERETGQAVSETVKQFVELGKSPVDAAAKLNESTNFLTASVARQIRILEEQGRVVDAARVAQEAYASALETRLPQIEGNLGALERGWRAVAGAAKSAWDFMLNVGRPDTLEQQLDRVSREIERARQTFDPSAFGGNAEARAKLQENLQLQASLQEQIRLQRRGAEVQAQQASQAKARLAFDKQGEQFTEKKARMEREILEARNLGAKAGATQEEIERRIAAIREKYTDKGAGRAALRLDRAELGLDIERIRGEAEQLVAVYGNAERRVETLRQAGLLSDREYYESKRAFLNLESAAKEDALQKELVRLRAEKSTGAEKVINDRKIADAEAKLAIVRADASAKAEELSLRQQQAINAEAAEFRGAQQAAEDYFGSLKRRQVLELSGLGMGRRGRESARGEFEIRERFGAERRGLENRRAQQEIMGTFTEDQRRQYEQRLSLLQEYEAKELDSWREHTEAKLEAEQDWSRGAQEALRNYADKARDVAQQSEDFFTNTFESMEDALAQFVSTGKLSFSDLVRSILADLVRLQAKQFLGSIADGLSGALGGLGGAFGGAAASMSGSAGMIAADDWMLAGLGGRAIGGPVSAGRMYRVNERSPELLNVGGKQFLMMGNQGGQVKPSGGGAPVTIVQNNTIGDVASMQKVRADLRKSEQRIAARVHRSRNYGGEEV